LDSELLLNARESATTTKDSWKGTGQGWSVTFLTAVDERAAAAAPPGPEDSGVELGALNMLQLEALGLPVGFSKGALRVPMDTEVNSSLCVRSEHRRKNKPTAVNQLDLHCLKICCPRHLCPRLFQGLPFPAMEIRSRHSY